MMDDIAVKSAFENKLQTEFCSAAWMNSARESFEKRVFERTEWQRKYLPGFDWDEMLPPLGLMLKCDRCGHLYPDYYFTTPRAYISWHYLQSPECLKLPRRPARTARRRFLALLAILRRCVAQIEPSDIGTTSDKWEWITELSPTIGDYRQSRVTAAPFKRVCIDCESENAPEQIASLWPSAMRLGGAGSTTSTDNSAHAEQADRKWYRDHASADDAPPRKRTFTAVRKTVGGAKISGGNWSDRTFAVENQCCPRCGSSKGEFNFDSGYCATCRFSYREEKISCFGADVVTVIFENLFKDRGRGRSPGTQILLPPGDLLPEYDPPSREAWYLKKRKQDVDSDTAKIQAEIDWYTNTGQIMFRACCNQQERCRPAKPKARKGPSILGNIIKGAPLARGATLNRIRELLPTVWKHRREVKRWLTRVSSNHLVEKEIEDRFDNVRKGILRANIVPDYVKRFEDLPEHVAINIANKLVAIEAAPTAEEKRVADDARIERAQANTRRTWFVPFKPPANFFVAPFVVRTASCEKCGGQVKVGQRFCAKHQRDALRQQRKLAEQRRIETLRIRRQERISASIS